MDPPNESGGTPFDPASIDGQVPDNAPRFARDATLTPQGKLEWRLDRVIPPIGESKKNKDNLYCIMIDSRLRRTLAPERPRRTRGMSQEAWRSKMVKAQQQARAYRETMRQMRELPDEFSIDAPERVWLIYEERPYTDTLEVSGGNPAINWTISYDALKALRRLAENWRRDKEILDADGQLSEPHQRAIQDVMVEVTSNPHPITHRLAAFALSRGGTIRHMEFGDTQYQLVQSLLTAGDPTAGRVLVKELVSVIPPTAASTRLLQSYGKKWMQDTKIQMTRVTGVFDADLTDPMQMRDAIGTLNQSLANEKGPPVEQILDTMMQKVERSPQLADRLITGIQPMNLPAERRDELIVYVIERAGGNEIAARWLNGQLLNHPSLSERTLRILNNAETGSPMMRPATNAFLRLVFGEPTLSGDLAQLPKPKLEEPIPVGSSKHRLFSALQSGQPDLRRLAWQVLPLFIFTGKASSDVGDIISNRGLDRYSILINAGGDPPPLTLVDFLSQQPDRYSATAALVRLVLQGSSPAAKRSIETLLGSGRQLGKLLLQMEEVDRETFARNVYQSMTGQVPLVTALMRLRRDYNPAAEWFGQQLAQGNLPEADQWLEGAGGEEKVMQLVTASDSKLVEGAIAALVVEVGGDDDIAAKMTNMFLQAADRSQDNFEQQFQAYRQRQLEQRLQQAQGDYRLTLVNEEDPGKRLEIGTVPLVVNQPQVSLGNGTVPLSVAENYLGLSIEDPTTLRNLPSPAMANVPLDSIRGSIELRPDKETAVWKGTLQINGTEYTLLMEPVEREF
jgi:hypothetical protein